MIYNEKHSWRIIFSLFLVAGGVALTSATDMEFQAYGAAAAALSALILVIQSLFSKYVMNDLQVGPATMQAYLLGTSSIALLFLMLVSDPSDLTQLFTVMSSSHGVMRVCSVR